MFRIDYSKLSLTEVQSIVAKAGAPFCGGEKSACLAG